MEDINKMTLKDFYGLLSYLEEKDKNKNKQVVPLGDSNKEMIRRSKELKKK